jgi:CRISPR-associated protein Cas2
MSLHEVTGWIVCYDIRDRKRLIAVHRHLKKKGLPLQYSVFLVQASQAAMHRIMDEIAALIDPRADDVRAYRYPLGAESHFLGRSILPDDVLITPRDTPPPPPIRIRRRAGEVAV